MSKQLFITAVMVMLLSVLVFSQKNKISANEPREMGEIAPYDENHPCVTEAEYEDMRRTINENRKLLGLDLLKTNTVAAPVTLEWPLKVSSKFNDPGYFFISAFVDLDNTAAVKDWNCGIRTYNGHGGTDIAIWPFSWTKMDNNSVEVVAAAPGKIISKIDTNFDRVCNSTGSEKNNYISIQQADGSIAGYVHIKKGSATSKSVGDSVVTGEYLATTASAGKSNGVHLHFEVYEDGTLTKKIDPFYGPCNTTTTSSWWANQNPDVTPQIMKLSLHSNWPYFGTCPVTVDTTYEVDTVTSIPNSQGVYNVFSKHVSVGMKWECKVKNPDGTIFDSWEFTAGSPRLTSNLGWKRILPTSPGIYTFEAVFDNKTYSKTFVVKTAMTDVQTKENRSVPEQLLLKQNYPNPFNPSTIIQYQVPVRSHVSLIVYDALGREISVLENGVSDAGEYSVPFNAIGLSSGVYFAKIQSGEKTQLKKMVLIR